MNFNNDKQTSINAVNSENEYIEKTKIQISNDATDDQREKTTFPSITQVCQLVVDVILNEHHVKNEQCHPKIKTKENPNLMTSVLCGISIKTQNKQVSF